LGRGWTRWSRNWPRCRCWADRFSFFCINACSYFCRCNSMMHNKLLIYSLKRSELPQMQNLIKF
jgi:hypothetical protein